MSAQTVMFVEDTGFVELDAAMEIVRMDDFCPCSCGNCNNKPAAYASMDQVTSDGADADMRPAL